MHRRIRILLSLLFFIAGCSSVKQISVSTPTTPPNIAPTSIIIKISTPVASQSNQNVLPNNWDGGVLTDQPCTAPCFAGIVPGVTTMDQAIVVMQRDILHFQNCQIEDRSNQFSFQNENILWVDCDGLVMPVSRDTKIVDSIGFIVNAEIMLDQLIKKYGAPTAVNVSPDGIPESPATYMIVFF
ncbi:MAG TPA: hypothetical protein VK206_16620 [Anaerolineales bacterium]|nr:hypothetical protein [Anaerolineales bacterium]